MTNSNATGAETVVSIEGLGVVYRTSSKDFVAVDDVSLDVRAGEIVGLVGESGAGKSTVGFAIARLIDYPGVISSGSIRLRGVGDIVPLGEREMTEIRGAKIGMIFQDSLSALLPVRTIGFQLVRAIRIAKRVSKSVATARAVQLLREVGIPEPEARLKQYPHQFSGGMRQRIVIAIALAGDPDLLIADEPTTALDVSVQAEILALLKRLARDHKAGVVLVTHDMAVIQEVADRVAVMRHGRLIEFGDTATLLERPAQDYTRALIRAVPRADVKLERFSGVDSAEAVAPVVSKAAPVAAAGTRPDERVILSVKDVDIAFPVKQSMLPSRRTFIRAAQGVTFDVETGTSIGIVGESGSGKSTLARAICGLQSIDGGSIRFAGHEVGDLTKSRNLRNVRLQTQMIFQDPFSSLDPRQRIGSALVEPMRVNGLRKGEEAREAAKDSLLRVGLKASDLDKLPHQFSGGQRQRICIARALAMQPRLLICDEPTSALDVSVQATILNLLKDLQTERSLTLVFISHDLAVIRQMCDRVVVMQGGAVREESDTERLFAAPQADYTKRLLDMMPKFTANPQ